MKDEETLMASNKSVNGTPWCLEMLFLKSTCSKDLFWNEIENLLRSVAELVSEIDPEIDVRIINEVNEVTPCNYDKNKFFVRVTDRRIHRK